MLLTGSFPMLCSGCFLRQPGTTYPEVALPLVGYAIPATQDHLPGGSTACSGPHHPTSVIYEENGPRDVTNGPSDGSNFSIDIFFPLMSLPVSG